jgi:hypothetical protein
VRELPPLKNVVLQQLEHDDMSTEDASNKPAATGRKPPRDQRSPLPQQPQIQPPLLNDGPELLRDSHC